MATMFSPAPHKPTVTAPKPNNPMLDALGKQTQQQQGAAASLLTTRQTSGSLFGTGVPPAGPGGGSSFGAPAR